MAQGKAWNKEEIVRALEPYLKLGYSVKKACVLAQFPDRTVYDWIADDENLRAKIEAMQGMVNAKAREVVAKAVNAGSKEDAKWWLERREKKDFSTRTETDVTSKDQQIAIDPKLDALISDVLKANREKYENETQ